MVFIGIVHAISFKIDKKYVLCLQICGKFVCH